jgi:hypothetical protein
MKYCLNDQSQIPFLSPCVDIPVAYGRISLQAEVAELADALRSGRSELYAHMGSTPIFGTSQAPSGAFCIQHRTLLAPHYVVK